jgi:hypothetical protein
MSTKALAGSLVLCALLSACADNTTNDSLTAPDIRAAYSESSAGIAGSTTVDGAFDLFLGTGAGSLQMAAAAPQAASGGRASGHASISFNPPFLNLVSVEYSFVSLRTDPNTPFAAKGQYNMTLTTATGVVQEVHGNVICMNTVGNTTNIAALITSVVVNGIPRPLNGVQTHNAWTVTDNGEGTPDTVSIMPFFPLGGALFHCNTGWIIPSSTNEAGNIQVR